MDIHLRLAPYGRDEVEVMFVLNAHFAVCLQSYSFLPSFKNLKLLVALRASNHATAVVRV